ncbi:hypothetical protein BGY98DRAFT_1050204 [Russula aff. rugulosa BPL654]|nr:hypothetical protein BGY98DRAFT_1050204 [Russula aff. rugulosa BPL654]
MHFSHVTFSVTLLTAAVSARSVIESVSEDYHQCRAAFTLQNGQDAQALNRGFQNLTTSSP